MKQQPGKYREKGNKALDTVTVNIIGRVGGDVREFGSGHGSISVASSFKGREEMETSWFTVVLWGYEKWPDWKKESVAKGKKVFVSGTLALEKFQNKEGQFVTTAKVNSNLVLPLSPKGQTVSPPNRVESEDIPF